MVVPWSLEQVVVARSDVILSIELEETEAASRGFIVDWEADDIVNELHSRTFQIWNDIWAYERRWLGYHKRIWAGTLFLDGSSIGTADAHEHCQCTW